MKHFIASLIHHINNENFTFSLAGNFTLLQSNNLLNTQHQSVFLHAVITDFDFVVNSQHKTTLDLFTYQNLAKNYSTK